MQPYHVPVIAKQAWYWIFSISAVSELGEPFVDEGIWSVTQHNFITEASQSKIIWEEIPPEPVALFGFSERIRGAMLSNVSLLTETNECNGQRPVIILPLWTFLSFVFVNRLSIIATALPWILVGWRICKNITAHKFCIFIIIYFETSP